MDAKLTITVNPALNPARLWLDYYFDLDLEYVPNWSDRENYTHLAVKARIGYVPDDTIQTKMVRNEIELEFDLGEFTVMSSDYFKVKEAAEKSAKLNSPTSIDCRPHFPPIQRKTKVRTR
jgi:hypothetical protein